VTSATPERFGVAKVTATHIILRCCGQSYGYPYNLFVYKKGARKYKNKLLLRNIIGNWFTTWLIGKWL
jgi:hypothetical protein